MAATYEQLNPASVLRDFLLEPLPEIQALGLAYTRIFGTPSLIEGGVASGRSIDMSGNPGTLHGSLMVRNARDILSAAEGKTAGDIGALRDESDYFAPTQAAFAMKQFAGKAKQPIYNLTHGFVQTAEGERLLVQQAAAAAHILLEKYCAGFFTNKGVEATGGKAAAGWEAIDWQGGGTGGQALSGNSDNAMDVLHSIIQDARLRGSAPVNAMYMGRGVAAKLAREASVLGRKTVTVGAEPNGISMIGGQYVLSFPALEAVLRDHLEIEEIVIGSCPENVAGTNEYIWSSERMWVGTAGSLDVTVGGGGPRVLSGAGAFCQLVGKVEAASGPEAGNAPQNYEAIAEIFADMVAVDPSKGTVIHNMG